MMNNICENGEKFDKITPITQYIQFLEILVKVTAVTVLLDKNRFLSGSDDEIIKFLI